MKKTILFLGLTLIIFLGINFLFLNRQWNKKREKGEAIQKVEVKNQNFISSGQEYQKKITQEIYRELEKITPLAGESSFPSAVPTIWLISSF